jgi:uncharacterized delta-60 repeat protein
MRIYFIIAALLANGFAISQTMTLRNDYGNAGIVLTDISNGTVETAYGLLQQTDEKLIAIGETSDVSVSYFNTVLIRYLVNGDRDNSFGTNGMLQIEEAGFVYQSAILQPDGAILLMGDKTGDAPDYLSNISVRRIQSSGIIDSSFGTNGIVLLPSAMTSGFGKGLALLSDGRIIVAGKDAENSLTIVTYGLHSNGTPDIGFGIDGKRSINTGFAENGLGSITVQSDNKILLAGYFVEANSQSGFFCLRLQVNAGTDNSFGNNGYYKTAPSASSDFLELNSVLAIAQDKILLTGHVSNPSDLSSSVKVIRLLPNGTPDNSFNGNGTGNYYKNLVHDSTFVIPNSVAVHPDSSIYVVGASVNNSGNYSQFIIRIRQNGLLDSSLSTEGSGWYYSNQGGLNAVLNDIVINKNDSSIFVAGSKESAGTNNDILIAAYKRLPDIAGPVYVFNGNGAWNDAANWLDQLIPPASLPNGSTIVISPEPGGNAILNIEQNIEPGGKIIVNNNARLLIEGDLNIGNP